jgi:hypothetical protein
MVVEERALAIAEALQAEGHQYAAARLREAIPASLNLCDEHVPLLREALALAVTEAPQHAAAAKRVLAALDDLPAHIGRRGRVWVGSNGDGTYSVYWDDEHWLEQGPRDVSLSVALEWAAVRTDDVRRNDV